MIGPRLRLPGIPLLGALVLSSLFPTDNANANNPYLDLNEGELLQKYVTLCSQAVPERIQLMQMLNPAERSYLWRMHLGLYLVQHPALTREQQRIVIDTLVIATPQLFNAPEPNNSAWRAKVLEPVEDLKRRGLEVFPKSDAAQIFAEIGGAQDVDVLDRYAEFSKLGKNERKVRFNQIDPQQKSELWRVHFALNLARHPEWTDDQRSIVLEAVAFATPALYQLPKDSQWTRQVDEPARLLAQRALLVFSKQEGAALFSELGSNETKTHHARPPAQAACSCSRESDWCRYFCMGTECTALTWGCGTMGLYACNGTCYTPPESN